MNIIIQLKVQNHQNTFENNINHHFTWAVISNAPENAKVRKNLGASYIALWKPDLSEQRDFDRLQSWPKYFRHTSFSVIYHPTGKVLILKSCGNSYIPCLSLVITIRFTCGDTKILSNIKMSQNIMIRIVVSFRNGVT